MEYLVYIAYALIPVLGHVDDPAYNFLRDDVDRRRYACERIAQDRAHELFPGRVPPSGPRARTLVESDALHCAPRILDVNVRSARDEAILSTLTPRTAALAEVAAAAGAPTTRWRVDAFYPEPRVALKVAAAARVALAEHGAVVGNGVPVLAAGDLLVLRTLPAERAFPLACARYAAEGSLADDEAFLGLFILDGRESELHAGTCIHGNWQWIP